MRFCEDESYWLEDYSLYMAVKRHFSGKSWTQWEDDIRLCKPDAIRRYRNQCGEEMRFYKFLQYEFAKQWKKLKAYANENGIRIIGDIPIYVAFDSADGWANPEMFQYNEERRPTMVAGCPPDAFSADGRSGAILCTTGIITNERDMRGGSDGWSTVSDCMMLCVSIISAGLTSIMRFLTEIRRQQAAAGRKDRG